MTADAAAAGRPGAFFPRLRLMRLPNAVTAAADVLAGGALAGVGPRPLVPLMAAAVLFYAGGCVLNDLRDRRIDRDKHPERPLPAGIISPPEAATLAIYLLGVGLVAAAFAGRRSALAAGVLLTLILIYDLRTKGDPLFGPMTMGACRAAAVLLGMAPAFPPPGNALYFPAACFLYVVALSCLARRERLPLAECPRGAGIAALFGAALLTAGAGALFFPGFSLLRSAPFGALLLAIVLPALRRGLRPAKGGDIAAGVTALIAGIPLLDAFAAAGARGWLWGVAAGACALPIWLAKRRFFIT